MDPILYWNEVALEANRISHTDLKAFFDLKHAQAGLQGPGLNDGHEFGMLVAQKMLDDREVDPNASDEGYAASMAPGGHRPDPDNSDQGYHAPFYGAKSKCFAVTARHELNKPPQPGALDYTKALREVRGKGIAPELMGTLVPSFSRRTVDGTLIGLFWAYDGTSGLGTPPRLYNQIVRTIAIAKGNDVAENARLFALVNAALGDAGILAWDQKYVHNFWRPVVAIREHDKSMGPAGQGNNNISDDCDPNWLPWGIHWVFDAFAVDNLGNPNLAQNLGGVPLGIKIAEDIFNGGRAKGLEKST